MARPAKTTVDCFLHDTTQRKTLFILKSKYGLEGYSFWFQLLEILGHTPDHAFNCAPPENREYITAYMLLDWDRCQSMLETLANVGAIDRELWGCGIIWSDNFVERLRSLYSKRNTELPKKPPPKDISGEKTPVSVEKTPPIKICTIYTKEKTCPEQEAHSQEAVAIEAILMPVKGGGVYEVPNKLIERLSGLYPDVDVYREILGAKKWCEDNPSRAKVLIDKFLTTWVSRKQSDIEKNKPKKQQHELGIERDFIDSCPDRT